MRVLACPDSFKGTLAAARVASAIKDACEGCLPEAECLTLPLSDGGEGALACLADAFGARTLHARVRGPLGCAVDASWALTDDGRALVEMAEASGLGKLTGAPDPLLASTYGVGELVACALDADVRDITMALGGSATNDGGMGFAAALGARFLDADGRELEACGASLGRVFRVDLSALDPRLREAHVTLLSDVDNPLLGPLGATYVFGPQKGAGPDELPILEEGMASYARAMEAATGRDAKDLPGAGAAGGLGFACLELLDATFRQGIEAILDLLSFDELLSTVDLVVTGEGKADAQTLHGKVVAGVLGRCLEASVPCVALVGAMDEGATALLDAGLAAIVPCVIDCSGQEAALANAERNLHLAADRLFSLVALGRSLVARK